MKHFLLLYNKESGDLVTLQEYENSREALKERFALERQYRDQPEFEVVVLNADTVSSLEATHSRYFPEALSEKLGQAV